jgi:hypothetical protein
MSRHLLDDLEDGASRENEGAAGIDILSDEHDFDLVQPLPAPADAKCKQPQKVAGGRKKSKK